MRRVILESPYAGNVARNVAYARQCVRDSLLRWESPLASHLLYTQEGILDDGDPDERILGIAAGREWISRAEAMVVCHDYGISEEMRIAINHARCTGLPVVFRRILS